MNNDAPIISWKDFARIIRPKGCNLLKRLDEFPNSILISGCQRSGTTMLTRIITESDGIASYRFGSDDELDAALILSGYVDHAPAGRYCFQTTYLNNCYYEYYQCRNGHKIVWVIRNPYSVVYSMLYNWSRFALNSLFNSCGFHLIDRREEITLSLLGKYGLGWLRKACYAYTGKVGQTFKLQENLSREDVLFVEYDRLIANKNNALPTIYEFLSLPYKKSYAGKIHNKSIRKANNLTNREKAIIKKICEPVYEKSLKLTLE